MTRTQRHRVAAWAICLVAAGAACRGETTEEVESTAPVSVKTAAATVGTVRGVVHATGIVTPAPGAELVVIAPEGAQIAEISHADGDRVRQGELLVRFDIPGSGAEVQRQQAEVARAEAALETARAAQTRARELFDRGVAARREVEDQNRVVSDAEAAVAVARASLAAAQTVATRTAVRATFNGVIARRYHNPGDFVEPSAADPVLRVVDPDRLEIVASIPLGDAPRVEVGSRGRMAKTAANSPDISVRVLTRPTAVEAGTGTVPVRLGFAGPVKLPVGAPVQVDIEAEQHAQVVLVPAVAIVRDGDETAVFVAREGKAERRPVEVGLTDGTNVEIVSGIKAGERVIVDGQAGLPDQAAIAEEGTTKETVPDAGKGGSK